MMSDQSETVRRSTTPLVASLALVGIAATTAWLAYRRFQGKALPTVDDLVSSADRAARALEERVSGFAIAS